MLSVNFQKSVPVIQIDLYTYGQSELERVEKYFPHNRSWGDARLLVTQRGSPETLANQFITAIMHGAQSSSQKGGGS